MYLVKSAFLTTLLLTTCGVAAQERAETPRQVSERYLKADTAARFEELLEIYAPDAVFNDPTGDVFKGPIAEGPIVGSSAIVALQKSWGLAEQTFAVNGAFAVGDIALHHGVITVRYHGSDQKFAIPFVTVHRVRDGRIVERTDFGEYVKSLSLGNKFDNNTASTKSVAESYLKAYLSADLKSLAMLSADTIIFQDPTASVFGEQEGQEIVGRENLMKNREKTFSKISDFGLEVKESFVANHHAVYIGITTYAVDGRIWAQPAVFVIEVRDGLVTHHWDYVDYSVGPIS